jgi:D-xylose 1-dehydrogenase (NADP+, D-xylono-1,5-lactone-forming)
MINWGFIGAGYIATQGLAPAVHAAGNANLYAVASRESKRSAKLSAQRIHNSYQDLIDDPLVDVVYINLPNHLHAQWTIAALKAGRNVLCEKPLSLNYLQAQEMAQVAKECKKLLVEAVWSRWHPRFIRAVELVKDGAIGELTSIDSEFSFTADLSNNYRQELAMGGGALLDVGPYQIHLWNAMADLGNLAITGVKQNISPTGVDSTTEVSAKIGKNLLVNAICSFERPEQQGLKIKGESGEITFSVGEAFTNWRQPSALSINKAGQIKVEEFAPVDPYQLMVEAISAQLTGGKAWLLPIDESLKVMQVIDQIRLWPTALTEK